MTSHDPTVLGVFNTEEDALTAISGIRERGWQVRDVLSPIPSSKINEALIPRPSRVGWFTLTGGFCGFFSGFSLAIFTATRWNLIVSGKPVISWIPFFIIAFEFTILFAVFGNILGLLTQVGLPAKDYETDYDPDCSGSSYGVVASAPVQALDELKTFLNHQGARIREPVI